MPTAESSIAILMAVYEPRLDWLREQLLSLNGQTCPNLKLYVRDDHSTNVSYEEIQACVRDCIQAFPYEIRRNEENLGSNKTFERLTLEAEGDFFAYCDQDDVWLPEKLSVLQRELTQVGALLACSDMYIIDENGKKTADSITKIRRHHVFRSGDDLAAGLLVSNFVTGCTMLVRSDAAKRAVPFCPYMIHDHYLALFCGARGKIISVDRPLICYRIHGANQTELLAGVNDKASYGRVRIDAMADRLSWLQQNFSCGGELKDSIDQAVEWAKARQRNWKSGKGKGVVWKYRRFSRMPSVFEVFGRWIPEGLFRLLLTAGKKNWI